MDQQAREHMMQDLAAKIARHISHEQALQGPLARNPDNHSMVNELVLKLIDQSRVELAHKEIGELCFRVTKLLFEPLPPRDPAAPDTRVIRWSEGTRTDQQARDRLLDELSARLARHISHRLGVAAPLPRDDDTYTQVQTHFTLLVSQSGVSLGPLQTHELYGKTLGALFEAPPPEAMDPPGAQLGGG